MTVAEERKYDMATDATTRPVSLLVAAGARERFHIFDDEIAVKVEAATTAEPYTVVTITTAPGGGPPLHAHRGPETVVVLSGEFAFTERRDDGVATFQAGPGAVFHPPGGAPHRFENVGAVPGTVLVVVEPAMLGFLREMSTAFPPGAEPDMERVLALSARYGVETFYGGEGARPEPPRDGATSERARALAWRFGRANDALVATIERCTPEQWRATCADTGWSVAVQAHHLAENHAQLAGLFQQITLGRPPAPIPPQAMDEANARHAAAFAGVARDETVALLKRNGAFAAESYRRLSDEGLARTAALLVGAPPSTVADLIEYLAIGEIERHGRAIREAIGAV